MESSNAIETSKVCYTYEEGTVALEDVDFEVKSGEFTALLGSNGSGKTTLLKMLVGLLKSRRGDVLINGRNIRSIKASELFQNIGFVLQNPNDQLFGATVEEDVAFGPKNLRLTEVEVRQRVEESLESVCALDLIHREIHHLSFGQQKRVMLAGVLALRPSILILDEPTAGLDPAGEALMMQLLNRLNREKGITIVLATHSVDLMPLFADRIYVLNKGKVLRQGHANEVFRDNDMIECAGLRLPYISELLYQMKRFDGVPINGLPLTVGDARKRLLELIPENLIIKQLKGDPA
jgi:cobalt/nickel transport system ATP-binding protein